jgi:hypothetical protein
MLTTTQAPLADSAERSTCLTIRLPAAQHDRLSDYAWRARTSMSDVVRSLIADHLAATSSKEQRAA